MIENVTLFALYIRRDRCDAMSIAPGRGVSGGQ